MLQLMANDCYRAGAFLYSAKAFETLERLDPNPEYWDGKRGACVGTFQQIIARKERKEVLRDVRNLTSKATHKHLTTIAGKQVADAVDGIADTVIGGVGGVVGGVAEVVGDVADAAVGLPTALSTDGRLSRSSRALGVAEPEPEPELTGGE